MTKHDGRGSPPTRAAMKIISLGWGVQSFAMTAMSALGILPPVDAAVHADTGWERAKTYALAEKWTPWLEERGVRVVTVKDKMAPFQFDTKQIFIPAYTTSLSDGSNGVLRRQCTGRWKIAPIRRWLREQGVNPRKAQGGAVEQWFGITLDEVTRMRMSDVLYVCNVYPLVEMLDRPWTRGRVIKWLVENDLEVPVKSSCVFCPYHGRATWRGIQLSGNGDWEKALAVDQIIRNRRPGYSCYVCNQRKPLAECDFRSEQDHGQMTLWDEEECSGMCFL